MSEPIIWPFLDSQKGQFLLQEEVDGIDRIKTPYNHVKTEISASKAFFIHFMQFVVHGSHTKNDIPMHLGQVLNDKKSLLVTMFTISFCCFTWQLGVKDV